MTDVYTFSANSIMSDLKSLEELKSIELEYDEDDLEGYTFTEPVNHVEEEYYEDDELKETVRRRSYGATALMCLGLIVVVIVVGVSLGRRGSRSNSASAIQQGDLPDPFASLYNKSLAPNATSNPRGGSPTVAPTNKPSRSNSTNVGPPGVEMRTVRGSVLLVFHDGTAKIEDEDYFYDRLQEFYKDNLDRVQLTDTSIVSQTLVETNKRRNRHERNLQESYNLQVLLEAAGKSQSDLSETDMTRILKRKVNLNATALLDLLHAENKKGVVALKGYDSLEAFNPSVLDETDPPTKAPTMEKTKAPTRAPTLATTTLAPSSATTSTGTTPSTTLTPTTVSTPAATSPAPTSTPTTVATVVTTLPPTSYDTPESPSPIPYNTPAPTTPAPTNPGGILTPNTTLSPTIPGTMGESDYETSSPTSTPPPVNGNTTACNGVQGLCQVSVNNVMFAVMHTANAALDAGYSPFYSHVGTLEAALAAGIRGINLKMGLCDGQVRLKDGMCNIGTLDPVVTLGNILGFVQANPNEVVVVTLRIDDSDPNQMASYAQVYQVLLSVPGFVDNMYAYTGGDWPTLQDMIDADRRILLFHSNGPGCETWECPPGFHDYFDYVAETPTTYQYASDILLDTENACRIDKGDAGTKDFYGVNLYVTLPDADQQAMLNSMDTLTSKVDSCSIQVDQDVSFVIVDFWQVGDVITFVTQYNTDLVSS
jgi:hypothetical protein